MSKTYPDSGGLGFVSRSIQIYEGQWMRWKAKERFMCCSCGLVHNWESKRIKGDLYIRITVNNRSTAQVHRHMKKNPAKVEGVRKPDA